MGAGSYGRVFAGKLGVQDVAIKVIHHDDAAAQQVASEVCLCLSTTTTGLNSCQRSQARLLTLARSQKK